MAEEDDDDQATRVAPGELPPRAPAETTRAVAVDGPTRQFTPPRIESTRAMPAGYGASRFVPPPRASAPRPAAGRPAVPSAIIDDPTSASDMTLIERIDAELESVTSQLSIPEGIDPSILDEPTGSGAEATIRMAVPDDLPSDLLDATSEPGTIIVPPRGAPPRPAAGQAVPAPPPSLSSMPTPALPVAGPAAPTASTPPAPAPPTERGPAAGPDADRLAAARAPAPGWVGPYVAICLVVSLLGALVLVWLKVERHW